MAVELEGPIHSVSAPVQKVAGVGPAPRGSDKGVESDPRSADKGVWHNAQRASAGDGSIASNVAEGWKPEERVWVAFAVTVGDKKREL